MGFQKALGKEYIAMRSGIARKTLVAGELTLLTEFMLAQGSDLPAHSHPHEQTGYLVKGHMALMIGDAEYDVLPGDAWMVPGGTVHSAHVFEDSVAVEVFAPVREDYLQ